MAKAEIHPGPCGFTTTVEAVINGRKCNITVDSQCAAVMKLGQELAEVDPYRIIGNKPQVSEVLQKGIEHCLHAACPVPVGIIKAVEVEAKLAVADDVSIKLYR